MLEKALIVCKYQINTGCVCTSHLSVSGQLAEQRQSAVVRWERDAALTLTDRALAFSLKIATNYLLPFE